MLLVYGWVWEELKARGIVVYLALWTAGLYGLPYVHPLGAAMFSSYVALLDLALVILIFKGDVRLT
jgi:hypothetical protein